MQITCHQTDSCAAKNEKLQLLLSQIGIFLPTVDVPAISPVVFLFLVFVFFPLTQCVYFSVLYLGDILDCLNTGAVTPQSGILSVLRKGNIRLGLFIDVNLNSETGG